MLRLGRSIPIIIAMVIVGMLSTKDPAGFFVHFRGLARHVSTLTIPGEPNALGAGALYDAAREYGRFSDHIG
mgnify:CR=1 FL=1